MHIGVYNFMHIMILIFHKPEQTWYVHWHHMPSYRMMKQTRRIAADVLHMFDFKWSSMKNTSYACNMGYSELRSLYGDSDK
jgi:hypothetical protein